MILDYGMNVAVREAWLKTRSLLELDAITAQLDEDYHKGCWHDSLHCAMRFLFLIVVLFAIELFSFRTLPLTGIVAWTYFAFFSVLVPIAATAVLTMRLNVQHHQRFLQLCNWREAIHSCLWQRTWDKIHHNTSNPS